MNDVNEPNEEIQENNPQPQVNNPSPTPEPEEPDTKTRVVILFFIAAVVILGVMFVIPALTKSDKGATSVIEDANGGIYREILQH